MLGHVNEKQTTTIWFSITREIEEKIIEVYIDSDWKCFREWFLTYLFFFIMFSRVVTVYLKAVHCELAL